MNNGKRRSENFSEAEKALLLKLVPIHLSVIEATENDVFTNRNKKLTWESITKQYNESVKEIDGPTREPHHLRGLYRRLKLMAKREYLIYKEQKSEATLEESLSKWSRVLYDLVPTSVESLHKERQMGHSSELAQEVTAVTKVKLDNGMITDVNGGTSMINNEGLAICESLGQLSDFSSLRSLTDGEKLKKRRLKSEASECSDSETERLHQTHKQPQQPIFMSPTTTSTNQSFNISPMSLFEMLQIQLMTEILNEIKDLKSIIERDKNMNKVSHTSDD